MKRVLASFKFENAKPYEVMLNRIGCRVFLFVSAFLCLAAVLASVWLSHEEALFGALSGAPETFGAPLWQYPTMFLAGCVGLVGSVLTVPLRGYSPLRVRWGIGLACVAAVALLTTQLWCVGMLLAFAPFSGAFLLWDKARQAQAEPKA